MFKSASELSLGAETGSPASSASGSINWSSEDLSSSSSSLYSVGEGGAPSRSSSCRAVRPLPRAPRPTSSSGVPRRLPARPLPTVPLNQPPSINVTPATALPVVDAVPEAPKRSKAPLMILTSPETLGLPDSLTTPLTPCLPQIPTPTTARRKRMSKLRRHLGETIPENLIPGFQLPPISSTSPDLWAPKLAEELDTTDDDDLSGCFFRTEYKHSPASSISSGTESASDDDDDLSEALDIELRPTDESEESESVPGRLETFAWTKEKGLHFQSYPPNRYSKHWVLEKRGRRCEEADYNEVLNRLRSL